MTRQSGRTKLSASKKRTLLKGILGSSSAIAAAKVTPASWTKPVVETVALPAHAIMTDGDGSGSSGTTVPPTTQKPCAGMYMGPITAPTNNKNILCLGDTSITIVVGDNGELSISSFFGKELLTGSGACNPDGSFGPIVLEDNSGNTVQVTGNVNTVSCNISGEVGGGSLCPSAIPGVFNLNLS